ncbi:FKBP-type peptidyl-prolyl cis-trans isomerase [Actinoplanes sp. KI2]|uniref:FKBP-type peptidyl-prolyl cis-trans isomerase n=1 Tax=Actinoplanes sp. KI2 TaxID=2983315 RepID=UPI0021D5C61A|nr:FKBP-type peptidyl-prolyl cis-trans isomerase [Actinoplanes sp. KI2]MCU7722653.1 FKBP-type peptidyl-prolyl cis-trans isomerase [Actinoplanes sp. KI2]
MSTQTAPSGTGDTAKRRLQARFGVAAGAAIIVVLVAVFLLLRPHGSDKPTAAAPVAVASASPEATSAAPRSAPAAVHTPAALAKEPAVLAGGKKPLTALVVTPIVKGTGPKVKKGQTITANYKLVSYRTGDVVDSSWQRGEPFRTPIGVGQVIKGWDQAIPGQRVGSRLQIDVPAALAYGEQQGDLRFVVDILAAS